MKTDNGYLIWGSAGHALVLADLLSLKGERVIALFDNNPDATSVLDGVPLYHGAQALKNWVQAQDSRRGRQAAVAIGGSRGADRQSISDLLRDHGFTLPPLIHPTAYVTPSARISEGCQLLANSMIGSAVRVMRDCVINSSANIDHECLLSPGVHVAPGATLCGCVSVGENTMIGAGACILPRVKIGANCIIGAGSVVLRDVPDFSVVVGNPARTIKYTSHQ
ncbi:acetyltransferase [Achromobacter aegrifaciens]|uniref:acetyltransferase n=1 Tax=Achromobacter aegrifaciens TaxID=1287736 RepID=UPI001466D987|nr:acetyltransferase [Achromobacter aegrifaciens]CAB3701318.1 UDP-3-O-(3-hydroxymyristoyl)glucosamine N-acyltransferase [Achromobacter aegrifaciens]